jgi:hypothetical protein
MFNILFKLNNILSVSVGFKLTADAQFIHLALIMLEVGGNDIMCISTLSVSLVPTNGVLSRGPPERFHGSIATCPVQPV